MSLYDTNIATYYDLLKDQYYYQEQMMGKLKEEQAAMMANIVKVGVPKKYSVPSTNKKLLLLK